MKSLELNQMENLQGGTVWGCIGATAGGSGVVIGVATALTATGPLGWAVIGIGLGVISLAASLAESDGDPCNI